MNINDDPLLKKHQNLYDVLGVVKEASVKEIKSAYRKKALECHPDKNPDDPKAAELFHELSRVLEILIDESARAAYDKILTAKLAAKLRNDALDSRRKRLKEDLEEKERLAQEKLYDWKSYESKFEAEISRLRKEASEQVKMEMEKVRQLISESKKQNYQGPVQLKLKWSVDRYDSTNGRYTETVLRNIFSKYGSVSAVIVSSKKKGSALIELNDRKAAVNASKLEKGFLDNPLTVTLLGGEGVPERHEQPFVIHCFNDKSSKPEQVSTPPANKYDDFEAQVLKRMREAEMNKRKFSEAAEAT